MKQLKPKKCKACKGIFVPWRGLQKVCSPSCAIIFQRQEKTRKEKQCAAKELRDGRKRLMTLSDHMKKAQGQFNRWIRLRDADLPCISCGRNTGAKMNCGHYLAIGSHPEHRFSETNCNKQCEKCNSWLSGNQAAYRINLIEKIGLEAVEELEGPHPPLRLRVEEVNAIEQDYMARCRVLNTTTPIV
jgi:hypothetical protein